MAILVIWRMLSKLISLVIIWSLLMMAQVFKKISSGNTGVLEYAWKSDASGHYLIIIDDALIWRRFQIPMVPLLSLRLLENIKPSMITFWSLLPVWWFLLNVSGHRLVTEIAHRACAKGSKM